MTAKSKFSAPEVQTVIWVQQQAPVGNWVNYTGYPYNDHDSRCDDMERAIKEAKYVAAIYTKQGTKCRVIRQCIEILVDE